MLPKINDVLFMQINSIDEEEARKEYKSRIAEIDDNYIAMEVPMQEKNGRIRRVYIGDEISAFFLTEGGVKNYFQTVVLGFKEDVVRLVIIKKPDPSAISKIQRRSFLRVPAEVEVAVKLSDTIRFLAKTEDIGGGGVSFFVENGNPIQVKDILTCWIVLPMKNGTIEHAQFKGELVRMKPLETGRILAMLQFTEIADAERQKVIRYCFERQLDFRKR
ncbi:flagellar brake protein [Paenibacillus sp. y28]|uniref:flagellar brake protein n=1 Tax=Paenibacillus sp. y28 TaxID=3129110 RepID=UPI003015A889